MNTLTTRALPFWTACQGVQRARATHDPRAAATAHKALYAMATGDDALLGPRANTALTALDMGGIQVIHIVERGDG